MSNIGRGMFRLWVVLSILWIGGMGWYQYNDANKVDKNSITISLSKDSELRFDSTGISQTDEKDKQELQMKRFAIVFLPPILLLLLFPVVGWLVRGFKAT
jgi:uncharacterized ion transporter superfamily protein YfcC